MRKITKYDKDIKVIIALPSQSTILARTAFSLVHAVKNVPFQTDMLLRMGCDIVGSRTWLVKEAIKNGGTHILFVDHDMYFPPVKAEDGRVISPIHKMLEEDVDIIGASYNYRTLPKRSTAIPLGSEPTDGEYRIDPTSFPDKPFKCIALGTGFLLIKLSVFEKWPADVQYFQFGRDANGELVQGEDTYFCVQARKQGYDVWADPTLQVGHIGDYIY